MINDLGVVKLLQHTLNGNASMHELRPHLHELPRLALHENIPLVIFNNPPAITSIHADVSTINTSVDYIWYTNHSVLVYATVLPIHIHGHLPQRPWAEPGRLSILAHRNQ